MAQCRNPFESRITQADAALSALSQRPHHRHPVQEVRAVGCLLEFLSEVGPGTVQDVMPAPSPVVAVRHVVHDAVGSDQGRRAIFTGAPGKFLEGVFLHLRQTPSDSAE